MRKFKYYKAGRQDCKKQSNRKIRRKELDMPNKVNSKIKDSQGSDSWAHD